MKHLPFLLSVVYKYFIAAQIAGSISPFDICFAFNSVKIIY